MIFNFIFSGLLVTIVSLFLLIKYELGIYRLFALSSAGLICLAALSLIVDYNTNNFYFQNVIVYNIGLEFLNVYISVGVDGLSLFFFILSSLLVFLCLLFIWDDESFKTNSINLLIINLFLLLVFSVLDLLLFYIFFEAILIPMFIIIGLFGSRERKIRAVFFFFFYTLIGSLCFLIGILYIYSTVGTVNLEYLVQYNFTDTEQYYLWLAFFLSFAAKIPLFPFHIWLPEAHVEAPTVGSVLLAGILLKLGVYGFLRFSLTLFPTASLFFSPMVYFLGVVGVLYTSFTAIRQTDLKRIIAYSSIAHMNLVVIGIFSFNILGVEGAILQSISHGFVSAAMFLLIGMLYNRYHSRFLFYYGGLVHMMPLYAVFFLMFTLSNIALPLTSSFLSEFLLLSGIFKTSFLTCFLAMFGVIICGSYSLWLYNRIIFGNLKIANTKLFLDLTFREVCILVPLLFLVLLLGIYPQFFITFIHFSSLNLVLSL